jgi:undecaprenyl-diphosphatase
MPDVEHGNVVSHAGPASRPARFFTATVLLTLVACVLALLLFGVLSEEVFEGDAAQFDEQVRSTVHSFATPEVTTAMKLVSFVGSPVFLTPLFVVIFAAFFLTGWRRAALWLAIAMAGATLLDVTLKLSFHRLRPSPFFGNAPHSYSYPSGHALGALSFYGVLAGLLAHRIRSTAAKVATWSAAVLLIAAIGISRVYLGVHYPTDVLAGYLVAAVWVSGLMFLDRLRMHRRGA